jgi:two-component system LytT family sensor kinase
MRGLVIGCFLYFISYLLRMSARSQQSQLENERLKQENLQARLSLLQEQVSPHFLFNSLGTLQSMVREPAPREFIQRLSEVYRYLLSNRMADLILLRAELDFTLAYLHILKERFEDALVVRINIAENALTKKLPPASLQLLIENAVKHNVATTEMPLGINIYSEEGWLVVSNSLQKKNKTGNSLGSGLNSIKERYQLLAGLSILVDETGGHFTVRIPLIT